MNDPSPTPAGVPRADTLTWATLGPAAPGTTTAADEEMATRGLTRVRTLVQLRRCLPLEPELRHGRVIHTRTFAPGKDEEGFLAVNNAAFHWHPEQGHWDRARLRQSLDEPWVDLNGFLVHVDPDGRLDGFCWTRVHPAEPATDSTPGSAALGEIYVIAAHPDTHGSGLGRALVIAGLDHLSALGLSTAMLYTEEDNIAARHLYERLGFDVHERRGGYL